MDFQNTSQIALVDKLKGLDIDETTIEQVIIHENDNWVNQILQNIEDINDLKELTELLLKMFISFRFTKRPEFISKEDVPKMFPISKRKLDDLVRARLIPFIEINQKNRVFNVDELYKFIEIYKVDSIVYRVDPVRLNEFVENYK